MGEEKRFQKIFEKGSQRMSKKLEIKLPCVSQCCLLHSEMVKVVDDLRTSQMALQLKLSVENESRNHMMSEIVALKEQLDKFKSLTDLMQTTLQSIGAEIMNCANVLQCCNCCQIISKVTGI